MMRIWAVVRLLPRKPKNEGNCSAMMADVDVKEKLGLIDPWASRLFLILKRSTPILKATDSLASCPGPQTQMRRYERSCNTVHARDKGLFRLMARVAR